MQFQDFTLHCETCAGSHQLKLDVSSFTEDQRKGRVPVISKFECPDVARMYRVLGFALDTRVSILSSNASSDAKQSLIVSLRDEWGVRDFEEKLTRYQDLGLALFGMPEEYYELLWQVTSSYCCGHFYSAMTSAGALGERILNRLILKTRDYNKGSSYYKKLHSKKSVLDWDFAVEVLTAWKVISTDVCDSFLRLKKFRNDSIHYNSPYDFPANAKHAVTELASIVQRQFNYIERKDILWVFDIPGEIWVKSASETDPFVREFVLPHCLKPTPYCEPTATPPIPGKNCPKKPISDLEFIYFRNNRGKGQQS